LVDTFIYSDAARGDEAGKSPGFGVTIVAETKAGWPIVAEGVGTKGSVPEDLGRDVALKLLEEISLRGTISSCQATMAIIFMVLGKEDIGRLLLGKGIITPKIVRLLRYIKAFWNLEAMLKEENDHELICTIKGTGFVSSSKKIA
jgi:RNA 3'-terminal phosphate cyclase-like protein